MLESPDAFLLIGPLRIDDLAAVQPDIIAGFPSPTAVAGFGYKVCLDANRSAGHDIVTSAGTAVIVHDHSLQEGHPKHPVTDRAKAVSGSGAPVVDELRGRAVMSFVIGLTFATEDDDERERHLASVEASIRRLVAGFFFGGGKAFPAAGTALAGAVRAVHSDRLSDALQALPPGFLLGDRRDLLETHLAATGCDALDALLDLVEFFPSDENGNPRRLTDEEKARRAAGERIQLERRKPGWLVPISVGFQGIETPVPRETPRSTAGNMPHVFAESLYSLGEYRSLRSLIKDGAAETLEGYLWRHHTLEASSTYYVSATGPLN